VIPGEYILEVEERGVKGFAPIAGLGARNWDWNEVEQILLEK
jgi:hypothetical protein